MPVTIQRPAYRSFLRSGSYPAFPLRMRKSGKMACSVASLVTMAALAAGGAYKVTQCIAAGASSTSSAHPGQLSAAHRIDLLSLAPAPEHRVPEQGLQRSIASARQPTAPAPSKRTGARREAARVRPKRATARQRVNAPMLAADASAVLETQHEVLDAPGRTELLAERAGAPMEGAAGIQATPARPVVQTVNAGLAARALARLQEPTPRRATPSVSASAARRKATSSILALNVRGSLSASTVRHGLERVLPALAGCYVQATQQTHRTESGRAQLRFTIDETGRAQAPKQEAAATPDLERCLRSVIRKLVCAAPDTGTVQASLLLDFAL